MLKDEEEIISNPYKVLGVSSLDSKELIKSKYKALAKKYHPDSPTGDEDKMREISIAWKEIERNHEIFVKKSTERWIHKTIFSIRRA